MPWGPHRLLPQVFVLHQHTSEEFHVSSVAHPDTCLASLRLCPVSMSHDHPPDAASAALPHVPLEPTNAGPTTLSQGPHTQVVTVPPPLLSWNRPPPSPQVQADPWRPLLCAQAVLGRDMARESVIRTEIPTALLCLSQLFPEAHTSSLRKSSLKTRRMPRNKDQRGVHL